MMNSRTTRTRPYLILLMLIAFAWRVQGLSNQSLWRDEVDAVYFALRNLPETLGMFVRGADNGVLYFLALRPWFFLVGASEFALRYPSVLAGTLSVPLLWQVACQLLQMRSVGSTLRIPHSGAPSGPRTPYFVPFLAATFLTFNPYQVWYGQEGKMYAAVTCLRLCRDTSFMVSHWRDFRRCLGRGMASSPRRY